jgi:hypothetical protein
VLAHKFAVSGTCFGSRRGRNVSFMTDNPGQLLSCSRLQLVRPVSRCAHVQKAQRRTTVRRTGVSKPNLVAAAVRLAGGPGAAATICGVSRQTIYDWINERRVERLIDALRLSRASGVAIENLAGDDVEKLAAPVQTPRPKRRGRKPSRDSPGR